MRVDRVEFGVRAPENQNVPKRVLSIDLVDWRTVIARTPRPVILSDLALDDDVRNLVVADEDRDAVQGALRPFSSVVDPSSFWRWNPEM